MKEYHCPTHGSDWIAEARKSFEVSDDRPKRQLQKSSRAVSFRQWMEVLDHKTFCSEQTGVWNVVDRRRCRATTADNYISKSCFELATCAFRQLSLDDVTIPSSKTECRLHSQVCKVQLSQFISVLSIHAWKLRITSIFRPNNGYFEILRTADDLKSAVLLIACCCRVNVQRSITKAWTAITYFKHSIYCYRNDKII
jgi:hypothetical protein